MEDDVYIGEYPVLTARYKSNGLQLRSYKELRVVLIKKFRFCFWCGCTVREYNHHPHAPQKKDQATIDHLKTRFERKKGDIVEKVLACNQCNQKRAKQDEKKFLKLKSTPPQYK